MKILRCVVFIGVLVLAACGVSSTEQDPVTEGSQTETPDGDVSPDTATPGAVRCEETYGECHSGYCDNERERVRTVTKRCCTPSGSCTTKSYRVCGC